MFNFPTFEYKKDDVIWAGKVLREEVPFVTDDDRFQALKVFEIANSWRDSHFYPMKRIRAELRGHLQKLNLQSSAITVARLKRMFSIRKKLRKRPEHFSQIQDLAGCRVIVPSMDELRRIVDFNRGDSFHTFVRDWDHLETPKPDGYRSFHRVYKFDPSKDGEQAFANRKVEIQFRTRLQHSWATAVEAVGLIRNEDIKGGEGDPDWRRLFELMSSEIAFAEGCPEVPGAPCRADRLREIKDIDAKIGAVNVLENLSQAFNFTEVYLYVKTKYFLIEYDRSTELVSVKPYSTARGIAESFNNAEAPSIVRGSINAVLVEADKIDALKEAYPNYFGDVHVFKYNLSRITRGKEAVEYKLPPQRTVPPPPKEVPDTEWFRKRGFRNPRPWLK